MRACQGSLKDLRTTRGQSFELKQILRTPSPPRPKLSLTPKLSPTRKRSLTSALVPSPVSAPVPVSSTVSSNATVQEDYFAAHRQANASTSFQEHIVPPGVPSSGNSAVPVGNNPDWNATDLRARYAHVRLYQIAGCVRDSMLRVRRTRVAFLVENSTIEEIALMLDALPCPAWKVLSPTHVTGFFQSINVDFILGTSLANFLDQVDFTVNTVAVPCEVRWDVHPRRIDPILGAPFFKQGAAGKHLRDRVLYTTKPAELAFKERPVLILRALRLHLTRGFTFSSDVRRALQDKQVVSALNKCCASRVTRELNIMAKDHAFETLRVLHLFPLVALEIFKSSRLAFDLR